MSCVVSWGPRPKFQQTELHMLPWHFLDTPVVGPPNTKEWKSGLLLVTQKVWSPLALIKILVPSISLIILNGYYICIIQKVYCGYRYMTEREGEILFFWKHETVPTRNLRICSLWFLFDFSIGKRFLTRINCSDLKTCSNGRSPILDSRCRTIPKISSRLCTKRLFGWIGRIRFYLDTWRKKSLSHTINSRIPFGKALPGTWSGQVLSDRGRVPGVSLP